MSDYATAVSEQILSAIEAGAAPWQRDWEPGELRLPYNATTGKPYRGINSLWLNMTGRSDPRWLTYKQAAAVGAQVRKGEKGTIVQHWMFRGQEAVRDEAGRPVKGDDGQTLKRTVQYERPRVMSFVVFNAEQIDGLEPLAVREPTSTFERHARAEALANISPAKINHGPDLEPHYRPATDTIGMPDRDRFKSADGYYATLFHEIGHSTGHKDRLGRDLAHPFGSEGYAREELRAEIASLMMGAEFGFGFQVGNHASYAKAWLKPLRDDPKEIFRAARDAESILNFVLSLEREHQQQRANTLSDIERAELEEELHRLDDLPQLDDEQARNRVEILDRLGGLGSSAETVRELLDEVDEIQHARNGPRPATLTEPEAGMEKNDSRINLAVPFAEKNMAKGAGARWDKEAKTWYAPPGADIGKLQRWMRGTDDVDRVIYSDPREEFREALEAAGLVIVGLPIMDGKIHRVPVVGDKMQNGVYTERSGGYSGFLEGVKPAGVIFDHRAGTRTNWKSDQAVPSLSPAERQRLIKEAEAKREADQVQIQRTYLAAAAELEARALACQPAENDHPYLTKKGVLSHGLYQLRGGAIAMPPGDPQPQRFGRDDDLLVPVRGVDGQFFSLQAIDEGGRKSFPRGARLAGGHHMIGEVGGNGPIGIAEGYATSADIHERSGLPIAVAFNGNNLKAVALALRERFPERTLIVFGDNDHKKEGLVVNGRPAENVGRVKAIDAAEASRAFPAIPPFEKGEAGSDWNDFRKARGEQVAKDLIHAAVLIAERHELAKQIAEAREGRNPLAQRQQERGSPQQLMGRDDEQSMALSR